MSSHSYPVTGGGGSAFWGDAVANSASLPVAGAVTGECRVVLDTDDIYEWNGSSWQKITENTADVTGPSSAVDDRIVTFDGTTGKLIQDSGVAIGAIAAAQADATQALSDASAAQADATQALSDASDAQDTADQAILDAAAAQSTANSKQDSDSDLTAIAGLSSAGLIARTGSGTAAARTITAGAGITVNNGDGVSGNPEIVSTITQYTDELAQDAVGAMVDDSTKVSLTYTDGTPSLIADIVAGSLVNADINGSAAIAVSKLAALTADRAVITDGSGFLSVSASTATQIGYLSSLTSNVQDQFNNVRAAKGHVSVSSNVTLTNNRIHRVDTSSARTLTLPAPSTSIWLTVKDVTGSAQTNPITISHATGTIDGASSLVIDWNYGSVDIFADTTNFFVV